LRPATYAQITSSSSLSRFAGGNVTTGKIFHNGQVKGENQYIKEYYDPPGWELGVRQRASPLKNSYVENSQKDPSDGTDKQKTI